MYIGLLMLLRRERDMMLELGILPIGSGLFTCTLAVRAACSSSGQQETL